MASKLIHELLPAEMFVMILKKLGYKSLCNASLTCKKWKKVIGDFKLAKPALGKFELHVRNKIKIFLISKIIFR